MINKLSSTAKNFSEKLKEFTDWQKISDEKVNQTVNEIIQNIRNNGDSALLEYCNKFDGANANTAKDLKIDKKHLKKAFLDLAKEQKQALQSAVKRIKKYHLKQKQESWEYSEEDGTVLGQKITPLDKAGVYVPGGKASYPSSVLMNVIPAKIAGVTKVIMCVPNPTKEVLAAAYITEVDEVFAIGGAQAVAAMAFGTKMVEKVDKIVGPGNIYVATAKQAVFGTVGIDMIAGPSEVLIISDGTTNPDWIAMDLFAQAEHDEQAQAILLSPDNDFIKKVEDSIKKLLPTMTRKNIIQKSLKNRGLLITTKDLKEAANISNNIAPEHLELSVKEPKKLLADIQHAGAIFLGKYSYESMGDYCAGPNHVLPTSKTARFSSPLGVYDFQKKSSIIMASKEGANTLGEITKTLAYAENLSAHAKSAQYRMKE